MICCCSLAGTAACVRCRNRNSFSYDDYSINPTHKIDRLLDEIEKLRRTLERRDSKHEG
jgi:hypothetical protein